MGSEPAQAVVDNGGAQTILNDRLAVPGPATPGFLSAPPDDPAGDAVGSMTASSVTASSVTADFVVAHDANDDNETLGENGKMGPCHDI